ncbi:helix-turn-helix domain-containing protein [Pandoraea sputorum]|uniref:helix-turn-helix domain-containing protein n=1 Tax=Pandoraea sputorum TaxID=93222 RepID=UPI00123F8248|nr:helix-turn-helix domain-containing protein [Pandoraea sputorum]VVE82656.1 hypothetical protein PSP31120_03707 [Pandoraea sputorum]
MTNAHNISRAITNCGGLVSTAKMLGVRNYQTVQQWVRGGSVPAKYAKAFEEKSGVSRTLLCKDWVFYWPELAGGATGESK